jgi:methylmalonyl-CoA mutase cobalamin-binding subunit
MLAAAAAAEAGWQILYLGTGLPAADIARAARQVGARAVALSAVYFGGRALVAHVRATARALGPDTPLFVGGRATVRVQKELQGARLRVLPDLAALRRALRSLHAATTGARA